MLPPASTLLSFGTPPEVGPSLGKVADSEIPECSLPTKDIVVSSSRSQAGVESHGGETDSPSAEETG